MSNAYGSTMAETKRSSRPNRFNFVRSVAANNSMHSAYDDLNEREEGFDLNNEMNTAFPAGKSSNLPQIRSASTEPRQSSVHSLNAAPRT